MNKKYSSLFLSFLRESTDRLGYDFEYVDKESGRLVRVSNGNHSCLFGANPIRLWPFNSSITNSICRDKELTNRILADFGISTPKSRIGFADLSSYKHFSTQPTSVFDLDYFDFGIPVVIKPNDGSQGKGISIIHDFNFVTKAIENARKESNAILIQEYVEGKDYRLYVLLGIPILIVERQKDFFFGDGNKSVTDLIKESPSYEKFIKANYGFSISLQSYLEKYGDFSPKLGERIDVYPVTNFSQAGRSISISQEVPVEWNDLCMKIFKALDIDFFAVDCRLSKDKKFNPIVIEVNADPGIQMIIQEKPEIARNLVDYLVKEAVFR